jgi:hypothetical protein
MEEAQARFDGDALSAGAGQRRHRSRFGRTAVLTGRIEE